MGFFAAPRLDTTKGPHGEIIVTKTYSNWRYKVTMNAEGAIHVKHGDWLSKYSAAMYNDFTRVHEFGRIDNGGNLRRIHNVNLIYAGETIYHIPTYRHAHPMRMDVVEVHASPLSEEQKTKVIVDTLKAEYHLDGERLELLEKVADGAHIGDTALEIGEIAGLLAEGSALVSGAGLLSAFLTPIAIGIAILNANETDKRLAGMQAIGYTLTAWAFGDPIPGFPLSLRVNYSVSPGKQAIPRVEQAWIVASNAAVSNLEAEVVKKRIHKKSYQLFWQAIGDFDRKKLVRMLMEARAEELRGVELDSFWGLDPDRYPN